MPTSNTASVKDVTLTKKDLIVIGILGLILLIVPLITSPFHTRLIATGILYGLAATGFNVLYGYTGLLSFGHAMFWGLGAYGVAIGLAKLSWGFLQSFSLALLLVIITAFVTGYLSLRHTRIYFAMLTLAFGQLIYAIFLKARDWTGGDQGLYGLPRPFVEVKYYYYLVIIVAFIFLYAAWRLLRTPLGLGFQAVRDNPQRAEMVGYPISRVRLASFIVSALITGVAGALYSPLIGAINPESLYWTFSATIVFMAVLGGTRTFLGPFVGGLLYVFIADFAMSTTKYWMGVMGVLLALLVYLFPEGVLGSLLKFWREVTGGGRTRS